jgi:hypothetical protein
LSVCFYATKNWQTTAEEEDIIMEDKELKKRLKKIPDADKNGDPIYKIDDAKNESRKEKDKSAKKNNEN